MDDPLPTTTTAGGGIELNDGRLDAAAAKHAAKRGDFAEMARLLGLNSAGINWAPASSGWRCVHHVAYAGRRDVLDWLLALPGCEAGAVLPATDAHFPGCTAEQIYAATTGPKVAAKQRNFEEMARLLGLSAAGINWAPASSGWRCVHHVAYAGRRDVLDWLLALPGCEAGAVLPATDAHFPGCTAEQIYAAVITQQKDTWDVFISHTQRNGEAKTAATDLYYSLKELGYKVWYDAKMDDRSVTGMEHGVRNSGCVVAIITKGPGPDDDYFTRPFCLQELRWALESEVKIQPVINVEDKQRIGEFMADAPADLEHLGGIDFIDLYRGDPDHWAVSVKKVAKAAGRS